MIGFGGLVEIDVASNRATWTVPIELTDADTGALFDLSGADEIELKLQEINGDHVLRGTLSDLTVTLPSLGYVQWRFTEQQMRSLCAGSYRVGLVAHFPDETVQLLDALVSITDGIVD